MDDASLDKFDIIGEHLWSAEVFFWNQSYSVTPDARVGDSAGILGVGGKALTEFLFGFTLINLSWMAELLGEEWDIVGWSCWVGRLDWSNWSYGFVSP